MTVRYLDNHATSVYDGTSWANAFLSVATAAAGSQAGDIIYVAEDHSCYHGQDLTWNIPGSAASPSRWYCGNKAASPPTTQASGAQVQVGNGSGNCTMRIAGCAYLNGFSFVSGGILNGYSVYLILGSADGGPLSVQKFENCAFWLDGSGNGILVISDSSTTNPSAVVWENCTFRPGAAAHYIEVGDTPFYWKGGGLHASSAACTYLTSQGSSNITLDGLDLSTAASDVYLSKFSSLASKFTIRNCKIPASARLTNGLSAPGQRAEMWNCDSGDTNYRMWIEDYAGTIKTEISKIKSGGASDGTTPYSWKMESSAGAEFPMIVLESPEIAIWNETDTGSLTVELEFAQDSAAASLNNDDIWLEVQYLSEAGNPKSTFASDRKSNVLPAASNAGKTTSSVTWTGLTNPTKQKCSVSIAPRQKGYILAKVCLAAASKTVYVNPQLSVA